MKKNNKSLFNNKKSKIAGAAAVGAAAAAAGVAAMVGDKDTDAEGQPGEETADPQLDIAQDLQDAAVSAAGDMADKVANVEQDVTNEELLAEEAASGNTEAVIDEDVVIIDNASDVVVEEAIVVEPAPVHHAEPVAAEPVVTEPVAAESVAAEPVVMEPVAQSEPVKEEPVQQIVEDVQENDVAIVVDDPMIAPEPVADTGDFYDPDVNVVNYMADASEAPDSGIGEMVGEWADGLMSGIKDLGDSISDIFTRDNFSDDLMNPGEATSLDEDANSDYINDANVDAFQ